MKRRGFLAAVLAVIATPALAQLPRQRRRPYVKPGVSFPEYRFRGNRDYMRIRTPESYWMRSGWSGQWRPCSRRDFYRAYPFYRPRYGYRLQRNYKSPVRIWWEEYVKRGRR
jgi:hypothetical protein